MTEKIPGSLIPNQEGREKEPIRIPTFAGATKAEELQEYLSQDRIINMIEDNDLPQPAWTAMSENPQAEHDRRYSVQTKTYASYGRKPPRILIHDAFFEKLSEERKPVVLAEELVHADVDQSGQLGFVYEAREAAQQKIQDRVVRESVDKLLAEPVEIVAKEKLLKMFPEEQAKIFEWQLGNIVTGLEEYRRKQPLPDATTCSNIILLDIVHQVFHHRMVEKILRNSGEKLLANKYKKSVDVLQKFRRDYSTIWIQAQIHSREIKDTITNIENAGSYQEYIDECQRLLSCLAL